MSFERCFRSHKHKPTGRTTREVLLTAATLPEDTKLLLRLLELGVTLRSTPALVPPVRLQRSLKSQWYYNKKSAHTKYCRMEFEFNGNNIYIYTHIYIYMCKPPPGRKPHRLPESIPCMAHEVGRERTDFHRRFYVFGHRRRFSRLKGDLAMAVERDVRLLPQRRRMALVGAAPVGWAVWLRG